MENEVRRRAGVASRSPPSFGPLQATASSPSESALRFFSPAGAWVAVRWGRGAAGVDACAQSVPGRVLRGQVLACGASGPL